MIVMWFVGTEMGTIKCLRDADEIIGTAWGMGILSLSS